MHNHLKTRSMVPKEPSVRVRAMPTPARAAESGAGPACSSCIPWPIAIRSAARLSVLAPTRAMSSTAVTAVAFVPNFARARAPRLLPVASAVRSQISCTAIMSGSVTGTVQSMPLPNVAPACA